MARFFALCDRRLAGAAQATPQLDTFTVDASTSLYQAFSAIGASAGPGRLKALFILCHGYAGTNDREGVCVDAGGMGLQLGRENVLHGNVSMWRFLHNRAENLVVYSCAASDTQPGNEGSVADGRYLMGSLAIHTNADVYAADRIQWYTGGVDSSYNFGAWEGTLYRFTPADAVYGVRQPPYELSDVLRASV